MLCISKLRHHLLVHDQVSIAKVVDWLSVDILLWLWLLVIRLIPMLQGLHGLVIELCLAFWYIQALLSRHNTLSARFTVETPDSGPYWRFSIEADAFSSASCSITSICPLLTFSHKGVWASRRSAPTFISVIIMMTSSLCDAVRKTSLNLFRALACSLTLVITAFTRTVLFDHFLPLFW